MEWPYEHPRRGDMPPGHHALTLNEYTIRTAALCGRPETLERLLVRAGLERPRLLEEHRRQREGSPVHGQQLCLGARPLPGRKDQHLGAPGAAPLRLRLQGEEPRRLRRGLADLVQGHRAVLRSSRPVPGHLRSQGEPAAPARQHLSAADAAQCRGGHASQHAEDDGPRAHAVSGGRHDRGAQAQQVSQPLLRARCVRAAYRRMRHPRGVRLADRLDLPGDGYREPGAENQRHRARNPGGQGDRQGPRRRVRRRRERTQLRGAGPRRRGGRFDSGIRAAAPALEVVHPPERHRQLERPRRPQLLRTRHGAERHGPGQGPDRPAAHQRRRAARRVLRAALPQPGRRSIRISSAATGSRVAQAPPCFPATRATRQVSAPPTRNASAITPAHSSAWAASGRCCRATRAA